MAVERLLASDQLVDYHLRPKAAYYTLRRELAPIVVGVVQQGTENAALWAVNAASTAIEAVLEIKRWTLEGALKDEKQQHLFVPANEVAELGTVAFRQVGEEVLAIRLLKDGAVIARAVLWPEPFKYLTLSHPRITINQIEPATFELIAHAPAKVVWLMAGDNTRWSDNMLDLMPDDPQRVAAAQLDSAPIRVRSLYQADL